MFVKTPLKYFFGGLRTYYLIEYDSTVYLWVSVLAQIPPHE
ncbi:23522_t:CDS:1, partial [Racocetra persica]